MYALTRRGCHTFCFLCAAATAGQAPTALPTAALLQAAATPLAPGSFSSPSVASTSPETLGCPAAGSVAGTNPNRTHASEAAAPTIAAALAVPATPAPAKAQAAPPRRSARIQTAQAGCVGGKGAAPAPPGPASKQVQVAASSLRVPKLKAGATGTCARTGIAPVLAAPAAQPGEAAGAGVVSAPASGRALACEPPRGLQPGRASGAALELEAAVRASLPCARTRASRGGSEGKGELQEGEVQVLGEDGRWQSVREAGRAEVGVLGAHGAGMKLTGGQQGQQQQQQQGGGSSAGGGSVPTQELEEGEVLPTPAKACGLVGPRTGAEEAKGQGHASSMHGGGDAARGARQQQAEPEVIVISDSDTDSDSDSRYVSTALGSGSWDDTQAASGGRDQGWRRVQQQQQQQQHAAPLAAVPLVQGKPLIQSGHAITADDLAKTDQGGCAHDISRTQQQQQQQQQQKQQQQQEQQQEQVLALQRQLQVLEQQRREQEVQLQRLRQAAALPPAVPGHQASGRSPSGDGHEPAASAATVVEHRFLVPDTNVLMHRCVCVRVCMCVSVCACACS